MVTYNGTVPGPTLRMRPGDRLRVHLANELDEPTNLHTHGLLVSRTDNGDNPFLRVAPGETFDYEITLPADHPPGLFWYHPHHHGQWRTRCSPASTERSSSTTTARAGPHRAWWSCLTPHSPPVVSRKPRRRTGCADGSVRRS
ncbi:multicopper oxidase domain-containing protein [Isoptericola sp. b441]|uniref:Multicopper oxidase domain-containing protein n=1 Tax=Actinotalea lenta TaxID=3064654 RepID=A0ABT9D9P8_9CELL|nr:multicopper oxidase domain-containing protein [Isoptericola sp. b441]MDO8107630.1 multicopper oxidase domain-containing protein [Isoptericola sp. b441]